MTILLISLVAMMASLLTFFSGFGLGTILSAVLFIFFDIPVALTITAIVHLANNFFKLSMVHKNADKDIVLHFGVPSIVGSILGALLLYNLAELQPIVTYNFFGKEAAVTTLKLLIAVVLFYFVLFEWLPSLRKYGISKLGITGSGLISGFFGGLSGHQGALRSAYLINTELKKEAFIATGIVIACMVDIVRLPVYLSENSFSSLSNHAPLIISTTLFAFIGAYFGAKWTKKSYA